MISTFQRIFPTTFRSLGFSLVSVFWLISLPALSAEQSDPFATENKTVEKGDPAAKKDSDDPFAPAKQVKGGSAGAAPEDRATAKATRKVNATPIDDRMDFEITVTPRQARRGETVLLTIACAPKPGFHTYPLTQRSANPLQDPVQLSTLKYSSVPGLQPLWPITESDPQPKLEEGLGWFLEHEHPFTWKQDILILPDATPGEKTLPLTIKAQACDAHNCVIGEPQFEIKIDVSNGDPVRLTPALQKRIQEKLPELKIVPVPGVAAGNNPPLAVSPLENRSERETTSSAVAFILQGIAWGAISLLTPCVFPMIPITVSFFLKQSEQKHHKPLPMALVYSATIVLVLTAGAVLLLSSFQKLSQLWSTNLALGVLFLLFALSLFGMYEIRLPAGLANFTAAREGRGGLVGTIFMALTFTIISFTCVAPFLGGFAGVNANPRPLYESLLGGLAFSGTFAAPFFFLALFPTLLRKLPKSGSWMNALKVVMGFLELAAALKFFRTAELLGLTKAEFLTYDFVLGIYVALAILCGLYLLNLYRLPHDYDVPEHLGVSRLLFSLLFLSLGFYLAPGLIKQDNGESQRPRGTVFSWVDAFLLRDKPEVTEALPAGDKGTDARRVRSKHPVWLGNLPKGLQRAEEEKRFVFLNFTGLG